MRRARLLHHRMDEPALPPPPIIALLAYVRDLMFPEEFRSDVLPCRLTGQSFHPILAEFENVPVIVGTRPGAALAIESILLVHPQPGADCAGKTRLPHGEFDALGQRGHSRRDAMRLTQIRAFGFQRRLGAGGATHAIVVMSVNRRSAQRRAGAHFPRLLRYRIEPRFVPGIIPVARVRQTFRMPIGLIHSIPPIYFPNVVLTMCRIPLGETITSFRSRSQPGRPALLPRSLGKQPAETACPCSGFESS